MNKTRRKVLQSIVDNLKLLSAVTDKQSVISQLNIERERLDECCDEEQTALDNRPESMMWSSTNQDMEDNISDISEALGEVDILVEEVEEMTDYNLQRTVESLEKIIELLNKTINR